MTGEGPDLCPEQQAAQQRHQDLLREARELLARLDEELGRVETARDDAGRSGERG